MSQKYYQKFINKKFRNCLYFFNLHFTWLYGSWHPQRILKKYPFWKYASCFFSEVSNLTSVRNMLNLPLKYWFVKAKIVFCVCHGPQKWSKYHLDTIQTTSQTLSKGIIYENHIFQAWKCTILGGICRSKVWQLWRKPAVIFSKWLFFQICLLISTPI